MNKLVMLPDESIEYMCARFAKKNDGTVRTVGSCTVIDGGTDFFYSRYILKAPCGEEQLDAVIADKESHGRPELFGFTEELAGENFAELLMRKGFKPLAVQTGMLMNMAEYTPCENDGRILRIGKEDVEEWIKVGELAFDKPGERETLNCLIADEKCEFYAYLENGRILGTLMGYPENGNYGIHEVATLPECQGRGIGRALTLHALNSAKEQGCEYASLQASDAGKRVYLKCGMEAVSTLQLWTVPPAK